MKIIYPYKTKQTTIHPGITINWCDEGDGRNTFIFIHGLAGYLPLWKAQIDELKLNARCIAIDLPGNGLSSTGDYPYSMFFYAESVARFIEQEKLENVILCGHSMGGQISTLIALRYPSLVDKLVLIAPAGFETFASHEVFMMEQMMKLGNLFYVNTAHLESTIKQSFFKENEASGHIISDLKKIIKSQSASQWNNMVTASILAMVKEPVKPHLKLLNMPVEIVFGCKDAFIPNTMVHPTETTQSIGFSGASLIPNAQLHMIENAGHFVHIEKSKEVNQLMKSFID